MEIIEITLNVQPYDGGYLVKGKLFGAGETTQIKNHFKGGNAIFPLYAVLREEITHITNAEIVVTTGHKTFRNELLRIEDPYGTLGRNLLGEAQNNDVVIRVADA